MNTDDLTTTLQNAVPPAPDPAGWAAGARNRSNRNRVLRQSVGTAACLVLVAALAWPSLGRLSGPVATPATPSTVETSVAGTLDLCSVLGTVQVPETRVDVPEGATGVFACDVDRDTMTARKGGAPAGVVVSPTSVSHLASLINNGPTGLPQACTMDLPALYALVFTWSGRELVVVAENGGCGAAGGHFGVGRGLHAAFVDAITHERPAVAPSEKQVEPGCHSGTWIEAVAVTTVRAWACYPGAAVAHPIDGWAAIAARLTETDPVDPGNVQPEGTVVAQDAWGDTMTLSIRDRALFWSHGFVTAGGAETTRLWRYRPSDSEWSAIAAALSLGRSEWAPAALCPADGGRSDAPLLTSLAGAVGASRCVTDAAGAVVEYPLNDKQLGIIADGLAEEAPSAVPCPTSAPSPARDVLVVRRADGTIGVLDRDCGGRYVGDGVHWTPTVADLAWWQELARR